MINKTVYQTWHKKDVPSEIQEHIDEMMSINPSYKYEFYDDDDIFYFIKENYDSEVLSAYESLNIGTSKADLWRYLVLYHNGGVYVDLDSKININLDTLINNDDRAIITREGCDQMFVQWSLIFGKGHPILERTIDKCVERIKNRSTTDIIQLTGPGPYSSSIHEILYPLGVDVYNSSDEESNPIIQTDQPESCRVFGTDYNQKITFRHKHSHVLGAHKTHWCIEVQQKSVFK